MGSLVGTNLTDVAVFSKTSAADQQSDQPERHMADVSSLRMTCRGLASLIAASTFVSAGCDRPSPSEEPPPGIFVADASQRGAGECEFDLSAARAESVFYVLGMLNDYNGRDVVEGADYVEHLYCNEGPLIDEFRSALERLAKEQGLRAPVEARPQDCLTLFSSSELAARLNSCYRYEFTDDQSVGRPDGPGRRRLASGAFNFGLLYRNGGVDRVRARAYLAGAWRRWGADGQFRFANASEKAEGIAMLLSQLGCSSVSVEHTVGMIPGGWTVRFIPTAEVSSWLE